MLITRDLDFSDIRRFAGTAGIVVVRLRARIRVTELIETILRLLGDALEGIEDISDRVVILETGRTRVRKR